MSLESVILLSVLAVSVPIIAAHALHRSRIRRSDVTVPDMEYLKDLEQAIDEVMDKRNELAKADASLKGRINALVNSTAMGAGTEAQKIRGDNIARSFLDFREESEEVACPYLDIHTTR